MSWGTLIAQFFRWLAARLEFKATPEGQQQAKAAREDAEATKIAHDVAAAQKAVLAGDEAKVNEELRRLKTL